MEVRAERLEELAPAARRRREEGGGRVRLGQGGGWGLLGLPSPFRRRDSIDTEYCLINHEGVHVFI